MMTSEEFRSDTELRLNASNLLQNPTMRLMVDILKRETPTRSNGREKITREVEAHVLLGAAYGYEMALDKLEELTHPLPEPYEEPKATYQAQQILERES